MSEIEQPVSESVQDDPWSPKYAKRYEKSVRDRFSIYPELHRLVRQALKDRLPNQATILMLGCGTGEEMIQASEVNANWNFVGVDTSESMLSSAKEKIKTLKIEDRCQLNLGMLSETSTGICDGGTAILVTHFLNDDSSKNSKLACAKELHARLKPGAPLVVANVLGEPGKPEFEREYAIWRSLVLSTVDNVPRWEENFDAILEMVKWIREDRELEIWKQAGFEVDVELLRWLSVRLWLFRRV